MSDKKNDKKSTQAFESFALSGSDKRFRESKSTIPDEDGVKEARDWVNHNKK